MRMVAVLLLAVVAGIGRAAAQAVDLGAPPGKIVDLGRQKIHLHCTGSGAPTVILEAGASSFAIDWALVQPGIARNNRVCSYDRAGSGWSGPNPDIDDPNTVPVILRATLRAAGETLPTSWQEPRWAASTSGYITHSFQTKSRAWFLWTARMEAACS